MGISHSKNGRTLGAAKGGQAAVASYPPQPPYAGTPVDYQFVEIMATLDMQAHLSFVRPDVTFQSTQVEEQYHRLTALYEQGFKMLLFVALPGGQRSGGFTQMGRVQQDAKFQGIFRRLFPEESGQKWQLQVQKSILMNQMFYRWSGALMLGGTHSGSMSDSQHIFQTINQISQNYGRLISVEMVGMAGQELEMTQNLAYRQQYFHYMRTGQMPVIQVGVDVFYEIPLHPSPERYMYQIINCPVNSNFEFSFPHGRWNSVCDWQGIMGQYLGAGWKLVEIFEDNSALQMMKMGGLSANTALTKNCLWIFEKPESRANDNTPYFEGTMVEHWFKTSVQMHAMGFGGAETRVDTNWEGLITHMGQYGWQVVRIVETPDTKIEGMFQPTIWTKNWIFFQRIIPGRNEYAFGQNPSQPVPQIPPDATGNPAAPPGYSELYPSEKH